MGNTLIRSEAITAGRVVWQDDISKIHTLQGQLQEIRQHLQEENILLHAEKEPIMVFCLVQMQRK